MGQILIDGAYKAPREVNFWTGLILLLLILAISLTGYLLPWDQKGYWATKVATNLAGVVPFFGEHIQRVIVGGPDYGHHTLTRFFALHAGFLPGLVILVIVGHIYLFRKHGITPAHPGKKKRRDGWFWPDQIFRDAVALPRRSSGRRDPGFVASWSRTNRSGQPGGTISGPARLVLHVPLRVPEIFSG